MRFVVLMLLAVVACGGDLQYRDPVTYVDPSPIAADSGTAVPNPDPLPSSAPPVITITRNEDTLSDSSENGVLCPSGMAPIGGGCECLKAPYSTVIYSRPGGPYKQAWQCGCSQPGVTVHVVCMGVQDAVLKDTSL